MFLREEPVLLVNSFRSSTNPSRTAQCRGGLWHPLSQFPIGGKPAYDFFFFIHPLHVKN